MPPGSFGFGTANGVYIVLVDSYNLNRAFSYYKFARTSHWSVPREGLGFQDLRDICYMPLISNVDSNRTVLANGQANVHFNQLDYFGISNAVVYDGVVQHCWGHVSTWIVCRHGGGYNGCPCCL